MLHPIKIYGRDGKLKQIISREEVHDRHWGKDAVCEICDKYFTIKFRRGPQELFHYSPTHDLKKKKNRQPKNKFCSKQCQTVAHKSAPKVKPVVMISCVICDKTFMQKNARHKICSKKCRDEYRRIAQRLVDAKYRREREKRKAVL